MAAYKPSTIVAKLAAKLNLTPIAESIHPDGTVVFVAQEGGKFTFDKDDITRTLTEPAEATPETAMPSKLEDEGGEAPAPRIRKSKGSHGQT